MMIFIAMLLFSGLTACGTNSDDKADKKDQPNQTDEQKKDANKDNAKAQDDQNKDASKDGVAKDEQETDGKTSNNPSDDDTTKGDDMNAKMKEIDFAEIEVEVKYGHDDEYEAEIEKSATGDYKAEIDDDLNNIHLKGKEAFDQLYPMIQKISVNEDASKDEAIHEILNAFDLDTDYREIEIEITFHDGKKMEYEDKR